MICPKKKKGWVYAGQKADYGGSNSNYADAGNNTSCSDDFIDKTTRRLKLCTT